MTPSAMTCSAKLAASALALSVAICFAQQAVNTQVNTAASAPPVGGVVRYSQKQNTQMMPSEIRNAYWTSGMLPSEIRGNYMRLGPNTPEGEQAYFEKPNGSSSTSAAKTISGSSYIDGRTDTLARPQLPAGWVTTPSPSASGSVRYSSAAPSTQVNRQDLTASQQVGSVRYDSRVR
jgi:hypothetical protein